MHVYRTAGRTTDAAPLPRPSARTLLSPLGKGALCLVAALLPPIAFNAVAPLLVPSGTTLVPIFEFMEDTVMVAMLASPVVMLVVLWRRVRPAWRGLWLSTKIAYVVAILAAQITLVGGAEVVLFQSRGGLKLFEPVLKSTTLGPGGRTAFVYTSGGLTCGWDVKVAAPFSPVMRQALSVTRAECSEPVPTVRFRSDGTVDLVDAAGQHLDAQPSPSFSFWHGC